MSGKDYEDNDDVLADDGREYQGSDYDGTNTYMQGGGECEANNGQEPCHVCNTNDGQSLESFENSEDFELTDDCGRTVEIGGDFRICEECLEETHDTYWHATHPEY